MRVTAGAVREVGRDRERAVEGAAPMAVDPGHVLGDGDRMELGRCARDRRDARERRADAELTGLLGGRLGDDAAEVDQGREHGQGVLAAATAGAPAAGGAEHRQRRREGEAVGARTGRAAGREVDLLALERGEAASALHRAGRRGAQGQPVEAVEVDDRDAAAHHRQVAVRAEVVAHAQEVGRAGRDLERGRAGGGAVGPGVLDVGGPGLAGGDVVDRDALEAVVAGLVVAALGPGHVVEGEHGARRGLGRAVGGAAIGRAQPQSDGHRAVGVRADAAERLGRAVGAVGAVERGEVAGLAGLVVDQHLEVDGGAGGHGAEGEPLGGEETGAGVDVGSRS